MARNDPQVNIRLPEELKEALDRGARESGRSLTAEIVHRLQAFVARNLSDDARIAQLERTQHALIEAVERLSKADPALANARAVFEDPKNAAKVYSKRRSESSKPSEKNGGSKPKGRKR